MDARDLTKTPRQTRSRSPAGIKSKSKSKSKSKRSRQARTVTTSLIDSQIGTQEEEPASRRESTSSSYIDDNTIADLLNEQTWSLCFDSNEICSNVDTHTVCDSKNLSPAATTDQQQQRADSGTEQVYDKPMSHFASSCSPEELASNYAVDDVVISLIKWYDDENRKHAGSRPFSVLSAATESHEPTSCKLEEMLYRRNVSIHCVVARMDMASKRQVLSAMRQQPHTHDAIIPWLGVSVGQVCTFQLMSKGMPTYAPGEPASERAKNICENEHDR